MNTAALRPPQERRLLGLRGGLAARLRQIVRGCALALVLLPTVGRAAFFELRQGQFFVLEKEISYRADLPATAAIEQVMAASAGWVAQGEKLFARTLDPINLWVRFDLPETPLRRPILLDAGPWEQVEYFFVSEGRVVRRERVGLTVPLAERSTRISLTPLLGHAGFVAMDLVRGSRTTVYARLASTQRWIPILRLRFYLWDTAQVLAGERRDRLLQGLYAGIMLVLVAYNLGLYFVIREPSYLYYVIMEVGGMLLWGALFGLTSEFLWPNQPALEYAVIWLGVLSSAWAGCQFMRSYLGTGRTQPRADRMLRWAGYLNLALIPFFLFRPSHALYRDINLIGVLVVAEIGLLVTILYLAVVRRNPLARHLLFASAAGATGGIVVAGAYLNVLPATNFTLHAGQIGSCVTGVILSMGLGFRLRQLRAEAADRQLAEVRSQGEHEREKRELVEAHNRGLESKVQERTKELASAREKTEALLANILPRAIIEELQTKGVTEPRRHEEVSILFTDFAGFTQTVATMPPKRLVQELDEIFRGFDAIVATHGLEKIKTIGDAYMAAAGLPLAVPDHAVRAVRTGLALTDFIRKRNETSALKWSLRVGVHSGAVVAGIVGKDKYAYDVWGDTVNIASRLESASEINRVNISAYSCELVRDHFACEYRGKLAAKGKGEIDMYFVTGEVGGSANG